MVFVAMGCLYMFACMKVKRPVRAQPSRGRWQPIRQIQIRQRAGTGHPTASYVGMAQSTREER